ncbi:hypothetical protein [Saccharopolyspora dendranthemae]|uniref:Uncharacterized protein n=1 Tax=Saccharopolyspora dendranthemae TaxID=1181886 RepID=A0A561U1I7_9PSEU|nr:hypothetical protein [Saccharopolyspora dendranthemae]TWF93232.1 hypothetical protein FHU35_1572 [Saccharopolyspora dendranthemae]
MSAPDTSGRPAAVVFAVLATLTALPIVAFTAFVGIWGASVPCQPGGEGGCTPRGIATGLAVLVLLAGPVYLWFRVRRPDSTLTAVVVGLVGLVAGPVVALVLMSMALNLFA